MQEPDPPLRFGIVEPGVYRSNALAPPNFAFIESLSLRTVVYLSPDLPSAAVQALYTRAGVDVHSVGLAVWSPKKSWQPVSDELVKEALEIVLDARRHPVLVVCSSGAHQTGAVVGCLRRLQQWNLVAILAEYRRFAGDKRRFRNEQFVELFDVDLLTLPEALPSWFPREEQVFDDGGE